MDIKTPLPGTFYRRPAPDQPPFKNDGDAVAKGDVVGLVEVMKSFHEVKSDVDGTISGFKVENEEPVMAGQVIAEVS
ncbi:MAG: acetyl-CoA carboxylase [Pseudomonadota bacterium]